MRDDDPAEVEGLLREGPAEIFRGFYAPSALLGITLVNLNGKQALAGIAYVLSMAAFACLLAYTLLGYVGTP